jgi:hypothetical protein
MSGKAQPVARLDREQHRQVSFTLGPWNQMLELLVIFVAAFAAAAISGAAGFGGALLQVSDFVKAIRRELPNADPKTDETMLDRGLEYDEEAEHLWLEALADVTNMHILDRHRHELQAQLRFFSEQFARGSDAVKNCISVTYARVITQFTFELHLPERSES